MSAAVETSSSIFECTSSASTRIDTFPRFLPYYNKLFVIITVVVVVQVNLPTTSPPHHTKLGFYCCYFGSCGGHQLEDANVSARQCKHFLFCRFGIPCSRHFFLC